MLHVAHVSSRRTANTHSLHSCKGKYDAAGNFNRFVNDRVAGFRFRPTWLVDARQMGVYKPCANGDRVEVERFERVQWLFTQTFALLQAVDMLCFRCRTFAIDLAGRRPIHLTVADVSSRARIFD